MKKAKENVKGITLMALVITIIVLLILAVVSINLTLEDGGIIKRADNTKEEYNKETARELINLKITNAQIATYDEKQRMPTLQEFADILDEDSEIQYVTTSSQVASLERVIVGSATSIFTKLNDYPYEFEINSSLQIANINDIKTKNEVNNSNSFIIEVYLDGKLIDDIPDKNLNSELISIETDNETQIHFDEENYKLDITNISTIKTKCTIKFSTTGVYTLIKNNINDTNKLKEIFTNEEKSEEIVNSNKTLKLICSSNDIFSVCAQSQILMEKICENSTARNELFENAQITEPILSNSTVALNAMKASTRAQVIESSDADKQVSAVMPSTVYNGKAFVLSISQNGNNQTDIKKYTIHGQYIIGNEYVYTLTNKTYASSSNNGMGYSVNKFANTVKMQGCYYSGDSRKFNTKSYAYIFKI